MRVIFAPARRPDRVRSAPAAARDAQQIHCVQVFAVSPELARVLLRVTGIWPQASTMHEPQRAQSGPAGEIEGAVLGYLRGHPDAADTLDGIVEWWLPRQRYETERRRVEAVLSQLVARGVLRCSGLPGGAGLYALKEPPTTPPR
jgi:hypothetical protein